MNIALIQPRMRKRPMDTDLKTKMAPSLALLTLKALTPPEHRTVLVNENVEKLRLEKLFGGSGPDLVAVTVTVDVFPRAAAIAEECRARGITVVAGGIHVTDDPAGCAAAFDTICVGMAEPVWGRMLADAQSGALRPVYGADACARAFVRSPDYAAARRDRRYLYTNVVSTSRGCPHRCDFCYNSAAGATGYLNRPVDDVLADIRALSTHHVMFIDDNFIGNPSWTDALLDRLSELDLTWHAAVTTRMAQYPELLDKMARTGCQSLFIGFESINPAAIAGVGKRQNRTEDYEALIAAIHARGIMVNASMVFGLDGDDAGCFDATLDWLVKNRVETVTAHILTPYPGTALHRRLEEQGRITDPNLAHYNTAHVVYAPAHMDAQTLEQGYRRFYKKFYSIGNIIRRYPVHKRQRRAFLLFNLLYRKFGRATALLAHIAPMGALGRLGARLAYRPDGK